MANKEYWIDHLKAALIPGYNVWITIRNNANAIKNFPERWKKSPEAFATDLATAALLSISKSPVLGMSEMLTNPRGVQNVSSVAKRVADVWRDVAQSAGDIGDSLIDGFTDRMQGQIDGDQWKQRIKDLNIWNRFLNSMITGNGTPEALAAKTAEINQAIKEHREKDLSTSSMLKIDPDAVRDLITKENTKMGKENKIRIENLKNHPLWYFPPEEKVTLVDPENKDINDFLRKNANIVNNVNIVLPIGGASLSPWYRFGDEAFADLYPAYTNYYSKIGVVTPPITSATNLASTMQGIVTQSAMMFALFLTLKRCQNEQNIIDYNPLIDRQFWNVYKGSDYQFSFDDEMGIYLDQTSGKVNWKSTGTAEVDLGVAANKPEYETIVISNAKWARLTTKVQTSIYMSSHYYELIKYLFEKHFISNPTKPNKVYEYTFWPYSKDSLTNLESVWNVSDVYDLIVVLANKVKQSVCADPALPALFNILGLTSSQNTFASEDYRRDINGCQFMARQITEDFRIAMMNMDIHLIRNGAGRTGITVRTDDDEVYTLESVLPDLKHDFSSLNNLVKSKDAGIIASALKFKFFSNPGEGLLIANIAEVNKNNAQDGMATVPHSLEVVASIIGAAGAANRIDSSFTNIAGALNRYGNEYTQSVFDFDNIDADASLWLPDSSNLYTKFDVKKKPSAEWKKYKFQTTSISEEEFFEIMARNLMTGKYAYDSQIDIMNAIEQYYAVNR